MPGKLILVRHGQSIWNVENLFTGWHDVDLSEPGRAEAARAGRELQRERTRAADRLHLGAEARHPHALADSRHHRPHVAAGGAQLAAQRAPLRRAAGPEQGADRREARRGPGQDLAAQLRHSAAARSRSDDPRHPRFDPRYADVDPQLLPAAESLKDTLARVLPFWESRIVPELRADKNGARGCARQLAARAGEDARRDVGERHRGVQHPDRHSAALRARRANPAA